MAIKNSIQVNPNSLLYDRFVSHVKLGVLPNIQEHKKNAVERVGDQLLWSVEKLPKILVDIEQDPRVITIQLTNLALSLNTVIFYPTKSWEMTQKFIEIAPIPPFSAIKFSAYLFTCSLILGASIRAFGRFSNEELMKTAYLPNPAAQKVQPSQTDAVKKEETKTA